MIFSLIVEYRNPNPIIQEIGSRKISVRMNSLDNKTFAVQSIE